MIVSVAAIRPHKPFWEISVEEWHEVFERYLGFVKSSRPRQEGGEGQEGHGREQGVAAREAEAVRGLDQRLDPDRQLRSASRDRPLQQLHAQM